MKLTVLTSSDFFVEEDKILTTLFEEGLDTLHLRKPGSEPVFCERLLSLIPQQYLCRIVVRDHFYLKDEFSLMGIHLSRRHPDAPGNYSGQVTRTCYSLHELELHRDDSPCVFLSNVFDGVSDPEVKSAYTPGVLSAARRSGLIGCNVVAEGGVTLDNIERLRGLGFGGAAVCGDLWGRFDIHSHRDFKDLIRHFRLLRKKTCE